MKKLVSIVCASLISLSILPIQSKAVVQKKLPAKDVLNLALPSEVYLDSTITTDKASFDVLDDVMEGLFVLDSKNEIKPGLVVNYKVSSDLKTYTFSLRKSKWSDGTQVTAHDFVYAWHKVVNPRTAAEYNFLMSSIKNGDKIIDGKLSADKLGVKAIDNQTLQVQLENPTPYFLSLLAFPTFYPQKESFSKKHSEDYGVAASTTLYNGPFIVKTWNYNKSIKLVKNSFYWDQKAVKIKEVNLSIIPDEKTMYSMYSKGKLDRITLSSTLYSTVKNRKELKQQLEQTSFYLKTNLKNKVLNNHDVRKALALTLDKSKLSEGTFNSPLNTLVPKGFSYNKGIDFSSINQSILLKDSQKAKEYWYKGKSQLNQETIKLNLIVSDSSLSILYGKRIKQQLESNLENLVINVKAVPFYQLLDMDTMKEYDLIIYGWGPDYVDSSTFLNLFTSNSAFNSSGYSNSTYDNYLDLANKETDLDVRWTYFLNAEKQLLDDTVIIPLYQRGNGVLQSSKLKGIYTVPFMNTTTLKWAVKS
ncbi:peptide ABC transporter substrate-binding protein [Bacillus sp. OAE603]|uniref:peptide ABC transporter substrate-binding protein n=1 Tax=Gottfriedia sp. OAE603 TaxID=2663872 RepID=UPI00178976B8